MKIPFKEYFEKYAAVYWKKEMESDASFFLWFVAQCKAESGFNPEAVSKAGACGLMQIMPRTWREIRLTLGKPFEIPTSKIYFPEDNIEAGIYFDRYCYNYLPLPDGEIRFIAAFAAFNAGPSKIKKTLVGHQPANISDLESLIPFQETRSYIRRIIAFHEKYKNSIA
jgi:soluble lytic murein transglycosylase